MTEDERKLVQEKLLKMTKGMTEDRRRLLQEKLLGEEWIDPSDMTICNCQRGTPHPKNQHSNRTFNTPDDMMAVMNKLVENNLWEKFFEFAHNEYDKEMKKSHTE